MPSRLGPRGPPPGAAYTDGMSRVFLALLVITLTVYTLVEVTQSDAFSVRVMPRWLWAAIVFFLPVAGPALWFLFGRPTAGGHELPGARGPMGPDDDPDFLRRLR